MTIQEFISADTKPLGSLNTLSPFEVAKLQEGTNTNSLYRLFRQCSLAVLNTGSTVDSTSDVLEMFKDFDIEIEQKHQGVMLKLINAPTNAFVDGEVILGIREHLFSVLRDLLYIGGQVDETSSDLPLTENLTNSVFNILRHADAIKPKVKPNLVVCWGGHSIGRKEYDYSK
ncbi:MAG: DUF4478 family protein, partial [Pseudomonadales bacterium]|nr:DUF4478 family protein [Pseudomonadales bacterium]